MYDLLDPVFLFLYPLLPLELVSDRDCANYSFVMYGFLTEFLV